MASFSTLSDNFDDGVIGSQWTINPSSVGSVTESGGMLRIVPTTASSTFAALASTTTYDLTNASVMVLVDPDPALKSTYQTKFGVATSLSAFSTGNGVISISRSYDTITFFNGTPGELSATNVTYDPVTHRYWRIRHASGAIRWETSPDLETWYTWKTKVSSAVITSLYVDMRVDTSNPVAGDVTYTNFDNFNFQKSNASAIGSASGGGSLVSSSESASYNITSGGAPLSIASTLTSYQPLVQKYYEYRVYTHSGAFIGIWQNVTNQFSYSQTVNQAPSELTVEIARSPNNKTVAQEVLLDSTGNQILDTNSLPIYVNTETANAVGPGTDVDLNYNVDVYAYYGGYEQLLDTNSDPILDTNSEPILVAYGAPNGKRVYSGYIADYEMNFGKDMGVTALIVPHATEMNHYVFKSGSNTTVTYNSVDPITMARDAMANYDLQGGVINYSTTTMPLSGWTSSYDFKLQTIKEVIDKTLELLPAGYYHYVDPGENLQYIKQKGSTANHTFYYEHHISELKLKKSITQLINDGYYIGGEITPDVSLFKHVTDSTSITSYRPGLVRETDSRVTLDTSATTILQAEINDFSVPRYRTSVTISDGVYDIETIRLGEMVAFKNFGSFVDNLLLQIVAITRDTHTVTLDLDMAVPSDSKRLEEIKRNVLSEAVSYIPDTPA